MHTSHCTLHTAHCTMMNEHWILNIQQWTLNTEHWTLNIENWTLNILCSVSPFFTYLYGITPLVKYPTHANSTPLPNPPLCHTPHNMTIQTSCLGIVKSQLNQKIFNKTDFPDALAHRESKNVRVSDWMLRFHCAISAWSSAYFRRK